MKEAQKSLKQLLNSSTKLSGNGKGNYTDAYTCYKDLKTMSLNEELPKEEFKEDFVAWFSLPWESHRKVPDTSGLSESDKISIGERIVALEAKYEVLMKQNETMFDKMFLDNGSTSIITAVKLHEDNIQENRDAIVKLETQVAERFDKIDKKLDHIHECIESAKVFNIFNILEHLFKFGETTGGKVVRVMLILLTGGVLSPIVINLVEYFLPQLIQNNPSIEQPK